MSHNPDDLELAASILNKREWLEAMRLSDDPKAQEREYARRNAGRPARGAARMTCCPDCPHHGGSRPVCCCDEPPEYKRQAVVLDGLQGNRAQRRAQAAKARRGK